MASFLSTAQLFNELRLCGVLLEICKDCGDDCVPEIKLCICCYVNFNISCNTNPFLEEFCISCRKNNCMTSN